jgi:Clp amino terminal domain, pathogenicity island component
MFDLQCAFTTWRQKMSSGGIASPGVLDELEAHLREDVEWRMTAGADAQAAFEGATKAIGAAELLRGEFLKLESTRDSRTWFRFLFHILPVGMLMLNTWTLLAYELSRWELALGILAIVAICLCLIRFPKLSAALTSAGHERLAKALKLASTLLFFWPVLALLEALHFFHLRLGIVANVVLWNLYAACALVACWNALNTRFRRFGGSSGPVPPFGPQGQPIPPSPPLPTEFSAALPPHQPVDPIVHQLLQVADDEAQRLGHNFIGTEHVLLGLLRLAQGSFVNILQKLSLDPEAVRREVERLIAPLPMGFEPAARPLTPRAGKAVKIAAREARSLNHPRIAAEHVLLGLLLEGSGVAAMVLRKMGVRAKRARCEILSELDPLCER